MALSEAELQIVEAGQATGKTREQIIAALANYREDITQQAPKNGYLSTIKDVGVGAGKGLLEGAIGTSRILQRGGQEFLGLLPGVDRKEVLETTGFSELGGEQARQIDEQLKAKNAAEMTGKVLGYTAELGAGFVPSAGRFLVRNAGRIGSEVGQAVTTGAQAIAESPVVQGVSRFAQDVAGRVPRFLGRVQEGVEEAATRAERIRTSAPAVQNALRVNLDERFINTVQNADQPTLQAYREMLDIAEDTRGGTLRPKENPSIVAGRAVENQFDLIENRRKAIGKEIEQAVQNLPRATVNMQPSISQLEAVLQENGLRIVDGVLDAGQSTLSKAQIQRLQELYDTARRASGEVSAVRVHGMDRLFSQLQREARFDQLDNIFINVNGEDVNAFRLFRDVYRNQLDNLSPEIRDLNNQYRIVRQMIDDAENSIFRSPNFEATRTTDPAEFAKVNLRRLAGEAQSTPAYQAVVEQMDQLARQLGYEGARADDLIYFAQELRKLYPETIPPTGFQGISTRISDVAERVLKTGAPNEADRQRALRELIESAIQPQQ